MKTSERVYWIKLVLSIISAIVCVSLQVYVGLDGSIVFMLGSLLYLLLSDLLANMMKLERNHALKIGIGTYVFTWIMTWTILFTILKI
ncbi:hypothetical protein JW865_04410 [Candidatus Bathyarchaeota archaeon]|nr:hypothetical protein [Candidatus Bathyarchaeota archaeon]